MIRILMRRGRDRSDCIATRRGIVETLAIISDMLNQQCEIDSAYIKLQGYLDGYRANVDEGVQIVINHYERIAKPEDTIEIRMMDAVERYTLSELRNCFVGSH